MKFSKATLKIGKRCCTIVQFNYNLPKKKNFTENRRFFIQLLDKSTSMEEYIDKLKSNFGNIKFPDEVREGEVVVESFKYDSKILEKPEHEIMEIKCQGKFILYNTRKDSKLEKDILKINLSPKFVNKFYILNPNQEEFEFQINNERYNTEDIKRKLSARDMESFLYMLAYEEYLKGNSATALDILSDSLRDMYLYKLVLNSFAAKERRNCAEVLFIAAHNGIIKLQPRLWAEVRFLEGEIQEKEPCEDSPCFMELLEVFEKNRDRYVPVPVEEYKKIGKRVTDNYNVFKTDINTKVTADFRDLIFNKERLNISVRYIIHGTVTINPRQAKAVGLESNVFPAKMYREQTLIRDGEVNVKKFRVLVCKDTLEFLRNLKVNGLFTVFDKHDYIYKEHTLIELNVSGIPVLNRNYVIKNDRLDYILDICYELKTAECRQKVLKHYIEKDSKNIICFEQKYTREQRELLQSFGLDSNGIYQGIDLQPVDEADEQYQYRFFEFNIRGFSRLPGVEEVLEKMKDTSRELKDPQIIMAGTINYLRKNNLETNFEPMNKLLEEQKAIIRRNTRILGQIKLAKILSGGWWQGLKTDTKDNFLYTRGGKTLVIKAARKVAKI